MGCESVVCDAFGCVRLGLPIVEVNCLLCVFVFVSGCQVVGVICCCVYAFGVVASVFPMCHVM